jgi:hypothetical protein
VIRDGVEGGGRGTYKVEEPVGHETDTHGERTEVVRLGLGHDGPGRDGPAKGVEGDVEVDRNDGDVRRGDDRAVSVDLEVCSARFVSLRAGRLWGWGLPDKAHTYCLADTTPDEETLASELFDTEGEDERGHDDLDDTVDTSAEQVGTGTFHAEGLEDDRRVVVHRVDTGPLLECHPEDKNEYNEGGKDVWLAYRMNGKEQR